MSSSDKSGKETVRIISSSSSQPLETVRIQLPTRLPSNPSDPLDPPSPLRAAAAMMPTPTTTGSPTTETARITTLSHSGATAAETTSKQDLIDFTPLRTVTSNALIPMPICWSVLATSGAILILQIWNYLS